MKRTFQTGFVLVLLIVVLGGLATIADAAERNSAETEPVEENFTSSRDIEFQTTWYEENLTVEVSGYNPGDRQKTTPLEISVETATVYKDEISLRPNETWSEQVAVKSDLRVIQDNHTVYVMTLGEYSEFNFTKEVNETAADDIPKPYIKDVAVENGTIDGEPSAVANVTVRNPTKHTFPKTLMVHTTGTDGSMYPASVPPAENRTITVELLDDKGVSIAGEARLYTDDLDEYDGALHQIEFAGQAGTETTSWNTSYQPVDPYWEDDHYQYENETIETEGTSDSASRDLGPESIVVVGVVLLLVALLRRGR